jgi:Kef-type K+ transport system membrane component KefB
MKREDKQGWVLLALFFLALEVREWLKENWQRATIFTLLVIVFPVVVCLFSWKFMLLYYVALCIVALCYMSSVVNSDEERRGM